MQKKKIPPIFQSWTIFLAQQQTRMWRQRSTLKRFIKTVGVKQWLCVFTRLSLLVFERFILQTGHRLCDTSACFSKLLEKKKASKTPREISTLLRLNRRTALSPSQTFWGWTFVSGWDAPLSGDLFVEWNEPMNEWMKGGKESSDGAGGRDRT